MIERFVGKKDFYRELLAVFMKFYQEPPELKNFYIWHPLLPTYLKLHVPPEVFETINPDLQRFGQRVITDVEAAGQQALAQEPELEQFDAWGRRIDQIRVSEGWDDLKDIASEEGLIALGYNRPYDQYSRLYQMAKLLLYTPSSAIYTCPLAMTDGATRLIETLVPELLADSYQHLISRIPEDFWVAGQWMTEREGGSDVANSSTIARQREGNHYLLYGDKWFTSAATSNMAMTLARIEVDGQVTPGSRGLSLFYLPMRDDQGQLNGIRINKLKDKLGTRALPTAELTLDGTEAILLGEPGRGVKYITTILNITRIYNALSSISYMGRGLQLSRDYAHKRQAFGKQLDQLPLHQRVLAELEIEYTTSFLLVFYVVELLGKVETQQASAEEEAILRLLTPIIKLYTGKRAISMISEVLESIGGMGYIEESGLPVLLRDAQVFAIWEGTTNVLSLDVLRAIHKEGGLGELLAEISAFLDHSETNEAITTLRKSLQQLQAYALSLQNRDRQLIEVEAREFSVSIARLTIAYLLLRFQQDM